MAGRGHGPSRGLLIYSVFCGVLGTRFEGPLVVANETFEESVHPLAGRMRETRPAPRFGGTPARVAGAAPTLGEHTDEVLAELGLGGEIAALRESGIVA